MSDLPAPACVAERHERTSREADDAARRAELDGEP